MPSTLTGVVEKIVPGGRHGPYAVASSESVKGSVTFSLDKPVWKEDRFPERGTFVILSDLVKKPSGWRAMKVRFFRPHDERKPA